LFLASLLGGDTLQELRNSFYEAEMEMKGGVSPRVSPFMDMRDGGALLQRAGYNLPAAEREALTFIYPDAFALMNELRAMGEANAVNARVQHFTPRSFFNRAAEIYAERHALEDGIKATFEVITLAGWSPDASQQKPLMPGTATQSLAKALNAREIATEDPARPRNAPLKTG
jgi:hypothetical protein